MQQMIAVFIILIIIVIVREYWNPESINLFQISYICTVYHIDEVSAFKELKV